MTSGHFVALLNDDTLVMPGAFEKMYEFFQTNEKIGAVGPKLLNPDMTLQAAGAKHNKLLYAGTKPVKRSFLGFAAIMFRKSMMNDIGLLDENYFFYNEELDYLTRVRRAGFECWYFPEAEIVHFGGQTTKAKRLDFEIEGIQGTFYFLGKFYPEFYPAYRVLYGAFAILVFLFSPVLVLRQRSWEERKKYMDFYHRMLMLALGWSRKKYVPRQFF
jgi:GT2 family glycosyltransferase